jgi:hypothetical protein
MLKTQNVFVHVPSIAWLNPNYTGYPHEYLAHGVISGPAHKAMPLSAFNDIGLPFDENSGHDLWIRPSVHRLHEYHAPISISEVQNALNVAKMYGGEFVAPVMAAILTLKKRDSCPWRYGNIEGLEMITNALKEYNIPDDWCTDADILTDIVDSGGYGEVEQMIRLLRALLNYRHGKGARVRSHLQKAD